MSESVSARVLPTEPRFHLARTAAPVWWSGGRSPSTDWRGQTFYWIGTEEESVVWRTARQDIEGTVILSGTANPDLDRPWAKGVLGIEAPLPVYSCEILWSLLAANEGFRPWAAGSLYLGFVSTVIGQSISLAAAAMTEQRLYRLFGEGIELDGKRYWAPPAPTQLADASIELVRSSGVTMLRARALKELALRFATMKITSDSACSVDDGSCAAEFLELKGIGRWTVQSALLWGVAAPDAHPSGDVALLRAARKRFPAVSDLRSLDKLAEKWAPFRGWAARLLWLDLLGYPSS